MDAKFNANRTSIQVVMALKFLLSLSIAMLLIAVVVADDIFEADNDDDGFDENLLNDIFQSRDLAVDVEGPEEDVQYSPDLATDIDELVDEERRRCHRRAKHYHEYHHSCPHLWTHFGDRCVRYFGERKTWAEAQRECEANDGDLISIHTHWQNGELYGLWRSIVGLPRRRKKVRIVNKWAYSKTCQ